MRAVKKDVLHGSYTKLLRKRRFGVSVKLLSHNELEETFNLSLFRNLVLGADASSVRRILGVGAEA